MRRRRTDPNAWPEGAGTGRIANALRSLLLGVLLGAASANAVAAEVELRFAHLHNSYFPDVPPQQAPAEAGDNYVLAPPPKRHLGFVGDRLSVPFSLVSPAATSVLLSVQVLDQDKVLASLPANPGPLTLYRALDVMVEGNSNGSCSCQAGGLPQTAADGKRQVCVKAADAEETMTPKGCPAADERRRAQKALVRSAPFTVKDALAPVLNVTSPLPLARGTELFIAELTIPPEWTRKDLRLSVSVVSAEEGRKERQTSSIAIHVTGLKLTEFPTLDLSYWISEDPRDLVARPAGTPLNAAWGGDWWSEEHWERIGRTAQLQARLGVTNTLVPLFVRNPAGLNARALVSTRCISGTQVDLKWLIRRPEAFNEAIASWSFEFDYAGFRRWVDLFRAAGFRRFEGAHLLANSGRLPAVLECDVFERSDDRVPYARGWRFLPRSLSVDEPEASQRAREVIYREKFLPDFLQGLHRQIETLGLSDRYLQHVIDENDSNDEAVRAYSQAVDVVRRHLPGVRTIDALNKYSAPRYATLVDLPVVHLLLIYNDQDRRNGIRREIERAFPGTKYFYNTAFRAGGPNRFLDTNPLESRLHGWLALETGYDGFLYWASNMYRYPTSLDAGATKRRVDWSPYLQSLGPRPGGLVEPGYGAGGNWILYPTEAGLIDSLRARRLRDGLLDHWLYHRAWARCDGSTRQVCRDRLLELRARLTRDGNSIADYSRNPRDYDDAREVMVSVLEP